MKTMLGDGQAVLVQALENKYEGVRDELQVRERNW